MRVDSPSAPKLSGTDIKSLLRVSKNKNEAGEQAPKCVACTNLRALELKKQKHVRKSTEKQNISPQKKTGVPPKTEITRKPEKNDTIVKPNKRNALETTTTSETPETCPSSGHPPKPTPLSLLLVPLPKKRRSMERFHGCCSKNNADVMCEAQPKRRPQSA